MPPLWKGIFPKVSVVEDVLHRDMWSKALFTETLSESENVIQFVNSVILTIDGTLQMKGFAFLLRRLKTRTNYF